MHSETGFTELYWRISPPSLPPGWPPKSSQLAGSCSSLLHFSHSDGTERKTLGSVIAENKNKTQDLREGAKITGKLENCEFSWHEAFFTRKRAFSQRRVIAPMQHGGAAQSSWLRSSAVDTCFWLPGNVWHVWQCHGLSTRKQNYFFNCSVCDTGLLLTRALALRPLVRCLGLL